MYIYIGIFIYVCNHMHNENICAHDKGQMRRALVAEEHVLQVPCTNYAIVTVSAGDARIGEQKGLIRLRESNILY